MLLPPWHAHLHYSRSHPGGHVVGIFEYTRPGNESITDGGVNTNPTVLCAENLAADQVGLVRDPNLPFAFLGMPSTLGSITFH